LCFTGSQRTIGTTVRGGFGSASTHLWKKQKVIESQVSNLNAVAPLISSIEQVVVRGKNTNQVL
jgi:hypothetical protein